MMRFDVEFFGGFLMGAVFMLVVLKVLALL